MSKPILLGYEQTSELTGIPINTLKDYRAKGKGPRSAVVGGRVKYTREDIDAWIVELFEQSGKGGKAAAEPVFTPLGRRSRVNAA